MSKHAELTIEDILIEGSGYIPEKVKFKVKASLVDARWNYYKCNLHQKKFTLAENVETGNLFITLNDYSMILLNVRNLDRLLKGELT